jgi:hypothetical protein
MLDLENTGRYQTVGSKGWGLASLMHEHHIHMTVGSKGRGLGHYQTVRLKVGSKGRGSGHYQTVRLKGSCLASRMHFETVHEALAHDIHGRDKTR